MLLIVLRCQGDAFMTTSRVVKNDYRVLLDQMSRGLVREFWRQQSILGLMPSS